MARARRTAAQRTPDSKALVKATVSGVDVYRWVDDDGVIQEAYRGDTIEVTEKELGRSPGALTGATDDFSAFPTSQTALDALAEANDYSFAQHTRTVPEKIKELVEAGIDPASGPSASELGYPSKQDELDKLAADNEFVWPEDVTTVKAKQAALQQAGIDPASPPKT